MIYTTTNQFFHNRVSDIVMTFKSKPNFISNGNWLIDLNTIPKKASNKLMDYMSKQPSHRVRFVSDEYINSLDKHKSMYRMHKLEKTGTMIPANMITDLIPHDVYEYHIKTGFVYIQKIFIDWLQSNAGEIELETNAKNSPIIIYKKYKVKRVFIGYIMPVSN